MEGEKKRSIAQIVPRYVRLRQGGDARYVVKLLRPPPKNATFVISIGTANTKAGVNIHPSEVFFTMFDWRVPHCVTVTAPMDAETKSLQIYHALTVRNGQTLVNPTRAVAKSDDLMLPSVFLSILQKEASFLFTFGCGLNGRLGTTERNTNLPPHDSNYFSTKNADTPVSFGSTWLHPVQIACGGAHSAVVDVHSNLYCFGSGTLGQLGQGGDQLYDSHVPLRIRNLGAGQVAQVACGRNHTMCLLADGKIYAWGDNTSGQLGLGGNGNQDVDAAPAKPSSSAGRQSFKKPSTNQRSRRYTVRKVSGDGRRLEIIGVPTRIEKVIHVVKVVCGGDQSFLLTVEGNLLSCGNNRAGQLGHGDTKDRSGFAYVDFFRQLRQKLEKDGNVLTQSHIDVASGAYHTLGLYNGKVYAWGDGDAGRLGIGDDTLYTVPQLVDFFDHHKVCVKHIACGGAHSGCITEQTFDVYLWGSNSHGQLGLGHKRNRSTPSKIRLPLSGESHLSCQDRRVISLALGQMHSLCLCEDGSVYAWGFGEEGQLGISWGNYRSGMLSGARESILPCLIDDLSGTGATNVKCGDRHSFVASVLETRQATITQRQRRLYQAEMKKEQTRVDIIEQKRKMSILEANGISLNKIQGARRAALTSPVEISEGLIIREQLQTNLRNFLDNIHAKKKKQSVSRPKSAYEYKISPNDLDSVWDDRPLTSRASIRLAIAKKVKDTNHRKEEFQRQSSPSKSSSTSRKHIISPRVQRMYDHAMTNQVLRPSTAHARMTSTFI